MITEHRAALTLLKSGMPQKDVAKILKKNENTIGNWVEKFQWREKIEEDSVFKEDSESKIRGLISYNLYVLELIKNKRLQIIADSPDLSLKELEDLLIQNKECDGLNKLFSSIKAKELDYSKIINIVKEVAEYVATIDNELAKELLPIFQDFMNAKRLKS